MAGASASKAAVEPVAPVPPRLIFSVPERFIAVVANAAVPEHDVDAPLIDALTTLDTVRPESESVFDHVGIPAEMVSAEFVLPGARSACDVPEPTISPPDSVEGASASNPASAVDCPVPPLGMLIWPVNAKLPAVNAPETVADEAIRRPVVVDPAITAPLVTRAPVLVDPAMVADAVESPPEFVIPVELIAPVVSDPDAMAPTTEALLADKLYVVTA